MEGLGQATPDVQQACPRPPPGAAAPHGAVLHGGRRLRRASAPQVLETVGETEEPHGNGGWRAGNVHDHFVWDEDDELGRGAFGRVFRGKSRYRSGQRVAVKELSVGHLADADSLWSEIAILSDLDHPHVLRFLEAFEDLRHVYVITEVCLGGHLGTWLPRVRGDARFAARVAQEVAGALAHCHARGVCHRDLKLDNILLVRDSIDSPTRVADFGLARRTSQRIFEQRAKWAKAREGIFCSSRSGTPLARVLPPGNPQPRSHSGPGPQKQRRLVKKPARPVVCFTSCAGTPEYMAPEVIRVLDAQLRNAAAPTKEIVASTPFYDFRCDVWSLGVVVHALLTGNRPFSLEEVSAFVSEGEALPPLPEKDWAQQPPRSRLFVERCLVADFRERVTAEELLRDPWIAPEASPALPTPTSAQDLAHRLRKFSGLSRFKRAALLASVRHLSAYEHEQLRGLFSRVDTDNSGSVTLEKLQAALQRVPPSPSCGQLWIEDVAKKLDSERKGEIGFTEFIAAVMDPSIEDRPELARAAFSTFDLDGDGALSKSELQYILENFSLRRFSECCGCDADADELSYEGFVNLLRSG